jgi:hypothetical protein
MNPNNNNESPLELFLATLGFFAIILLIVFI